MFPKEHFHFLFCSRRLPVITPVSPSLRVPPSSPSGHQQSVQLSKGGPPAASGPGGQETGPLPGVRCSCSGPAGLRVRTRRSLARLHLVNSFFLKKGFTVTEGTLVSSQFSAIQNLLLAAGNLSILQTVPNWLCMLNVTPALPILYISNHLLLFYLHVLLLSFLQWLIC